jgi:hypothetical protein
VALIASRRSRLGPAPPSTAPAAFGASTAAITGDPLSVPEQPLPIEQYADEAPEPLWLRLPSHLAPYFDLGFAHTDETCPYVVLRARDDSLEGGSVEVGGPPSAFLELAEVIAALCRSVPCIQHRASGDLAYRDAG